MGEIAASAALRSDPGPHPPSPHLVEARQLTAHNSIRQVGVDFSTREPLHHLTDHRSQALDLLLKVFPLEVHLGLEALLVGLQVLLADGYLGVAL